MQSEAYLRYEEDALWQLKPFYNREKWPPGAAINLQARYWMKDRSSWPDLIGLLQATSDILQKSGVIFNDRDIRGYDGSRIVGIDKDNPRVEITIEELTE